jgi:hypothetical protein
VFIITIHPVAQLRAEAGISYVVAFLFVSLYIVYSVQGIVYSVQDIVYSVYSV